LGYHTSKEVIDMHFVAQVYKEEQENIREQGKEANTIVLRGYNPKIWVGPELMEVKLPVNAIAYNLCITGRDLYLERIKGVRSPETWERYTGRVIDSVYKLSHEFCEAYVLRQANINSNLETYLVKNQSRIINRAKEEHSSVLSKISFQPNQSLMCRFDSTLQKIIRSEGRIASSLIDFEIGRVEGATPKGIFNEYLGFNTNVVLRSPHLGFTGKVSPDFIYRHEVIGDIKTGTWQEFFMYTAIAYALAYEEHTRRDMNYGTILYPEFPRNQRIPVYRHTSIEFLGDLMRLAFKVVRDRKLQIVHDKKDPGKPDSKDKCDLGCPFLPNCWGKRR
jgi:CRISPR/Cas system-associated exonuclease Cas4 (RecB family)